MVPGLYPNDLLKQAVKNNAALAHKAGGHVKPNCLWPLCFKAENRSKYHQVNNGSRFH